MKVKELIEKLQECPQDYKVFVYNCYGRPLEFGEGLKSIEIYDNKKEVWI